MKKIIAFAVLVILFASCKKSNSGDIIALNTISATIDGTNYVFNKNVSTYLSYNSEDTAHTFSFSAIDSNYNSFAITLFAINSFKTISYHEQSDFINGQADFIFLPINDSLYSYSYSSTPLTVTLTTVNDVSIQGTFSGILYQMGDNTKTSRVITNGKFNLARN